MRRFYVVPRDAESKSSCAIGTLIKESRKFYLPSTGWMASGRWTSSCLQSSPVIFYGESSQEKFLLHPTTSRKMVPVVLGVKAKSPVTFSQANLSFTNSCSVVDE